MPLAYVSVYVFGRVGLSLRIATAAMFLHRPSAVTALLLIFAVAGSEILTLTFSIKSSSDTLGSLNNRIDTVGADKEWIISEPFQRDELTNLFKIIYMEPPQYFKIRQALLFINHKGSLKISPQCYFNAIGTTFVETMLTGRDLDSLTPIQRFFVFHEIGHASMEGGDLWNHGRATVVLNWFAVFLTVGTMVEKSLWLVTLLLLGAVFLSMYVLDAIRTDDTETYADRFGIRFLLRSSLTDAISVTKRLISDWSEKFNTAESAIRRGELKARIISLKDVLDYLDKRKDGRQPVFYDDMWDCAKFPQHYVFAFLLAFAVFHSGNDVWFQRSSLLILVVTTGFLAVIGKRLSYTVAILQAEIFEKLERHKGEAVVSNTPVLAASMAGQLNQDVKEIVPTETLESVAQRIFAGEDVHSIYDEMRSLEPEAAPFDLQELALMSVQLIVTVKATWDFIEFSDKVIDVVVDNDKKLKIAEHVIALLEKAGMPASAEVVRGWVDAILEKMTRPPTDEESKGSDDSEV